MEKEYYRDAFEFAMKELKEEYKSKNSEDDFTLWFNMTFVKDTIDSITVSVPSAFMQKMMTSKGYFSIVEKKLQETVGQKIKINCIVNTENQDKKEAAAAKIPANKETKTSSGAAEFSLENPPSEKPEAPKKHPLLQENFTFDTFIPGENSDFAYKASFAVSQNPGKKYNPILIYGGSGLGKTHLMQAIGNYIYTHGGEKLKIYYGSAESFTNEFTGSLASKKTNQFNNKFRNLDVLLLDDIHFLSNKSGVQEALFYTFNALHEKQAQMVFTCDRPIKEIKNMTDRLVSRLSNGICIDITIPNYETRVAILRKKLELMNKSLDPEIIDYIAKNVETNVRELESALKQILAYADIIEQKPTLEMAKNQLKDILNNNTVQNVSLDIIQKVIADNYQISISDLKSKKRDKKFVIPRQIAIYISRELTEISYSELGNEFGGKDHSTIMHAYDKIAESIKIDSTLESKINILIREIKEYKK
ncbi:MAG: chromosomal replication initiator protein DnaA [Treponema sp.]|nr:chromosomal replication initiator protein DnaA [Treponema sp.]MBR5033458.1 chromosomal replication initiator protein DnaA [Treponema sp.]